MFRGCLRLLLLVFVVLVEVFLFRQVAVFVKLLVIFVFFFDVVFPGAVIIAF